MSKKKNAPAVVSSLDVKIKMLPRQQRKAYGFIAQRLAQGWPPTYEEIAAHMGGITRSGAFQTVKGLVQKGLLVHTGRDRGLSIAGVDTCPTCGQALPAKKSSKKAASDGN